MGKQITSYMFGTDYENENNYGLELTVLQEEIIIKDLSTIEEDIVARFSIEDWDELRNFIDNQLKNI